MGRGRKKPGPSLSDLSTRERSVTLLHHYGGRARMRAHIDENDHIWVDWPVAGAYEIALASGRVMGLPRVANNNTKPMWVMQEEDLAWFRKRSRRWQARKAARRAFLGGREKAS